MEIKFEYFDDLPIATVKQWDLETDDGPGYEWHTVRLTRSTLQAMQPAHDLSGCPDVEDASLTPVSRRKEESWPADLCAAMEAALEKGCNGRTFRVTTRNALCVHLDDGDDVLGGVAARAIEEYIDARLINRQSPDWDEVAAMILAEAE